MVMHGLVPAEAAMQTSFGIVPSPIVAQQKPGRTDRLEVRKNNRDYELESVDRHDFKKRNR